MQEQQQEQWVQLAAELMAVRARGAVPMAVVRTYGCQQNVADSEKIRGVLAEMGFSFTDDETQADLVLFNTCAVRENAEYRVYGNVGNLKNLKREHPGMLIAVCGCMMEQEHVAEKIRKSYPYVNLVFGTNLAHRLPQMLCRVLSSGKRVFERGGPTEMIEGVPVLRDRDIRAWLTVMYGCDNFCSYCIVPYVRGRERSRELAAVEEEFCGLLEQGYREIVLLGQNVNSYGKNLTPPVSFAELLRRLDAVPGDYRIRFMTSHPKDATRELLDVMAQSRHICHSLHLPFQAGNNRVLRAMNRGYTREAYLELVQYAREKMPDLTLTSDIIVGFPGETYEEFQDTVSLVREVGFTALFTFLYSRRTGTRAAQMDDPIPQEEKSRWFQELLAAQEETSEKNSPSILGTIQRVLVEEYNEKRGLLAGKTEGNLNCDFPGDVSLIGSFTDVRVTQSHHWVLKGEPISTHTGG